VGILDFFRRGERPEAVVLDPQLGDLRWSEQDEGWLGSFNGFSFSLAYEKVSRPAQQLVAYALRLMQKREWLTQTLEAEKEKWKREYPAQAAEIDALEFDHLGFYRYKSANQVFANLTPESDDRCWRIEYKEDTCMGLGYDS